jgi:rod shape-determining protein MreB
LAAALTWNRLIPLASIVVHFLYFVLPRREGHDRMNLGGLGRIFSSDLAVDLGTSNTRLYVRGAGVVLDEPSVVAVDMGGVVQAVGNEAKAMLGRAPGTVQVVRPLRHGVIADFDRTQKMFRYFINKTRSRWSFVQPRLVIVTPSGITQVERRAVRDAARQAGAREVYLIQASMAAALGAGLPVAEPGASMIVDIGGGTTEVAVMSLCGVVYCESLRTAGDELNQAVIQYLRRSYDLLVGERRAEDAKIRLGSAYPKDDDNDGMEVQGRDLLDGLPKTVVITALEVREALREPVVDIVTAVRACLEQTPPELAADISDNGIVLTGGGALLRGLDDLLHHETGLPIRVTDDPLTCVVRGAGTVLDQLDILRRVAIPA